jgi:hypothetical protein
MPALQGLKEVRNMPELGNQFSAAGGGYLQASLRFAVADTRHGLQGLVADDFAAIKAHVQSHPYNSGAANYVARVETVIGKPPGAPSKPMKPHM